MPVNGLRIADRSPPVTIPPTGSAAMHEPFDNTPAGITLHALQRPVAGFALGSGVRRCHGESVLYKRDHMYKLGA